MDKSGFGDCQENVTSIVLTLKFWKLDNAIRLSVVGPGPLVPGKGSLLGNSLEKALLCCGADLGDQLYINACRPRIGCHKFRVGVMCK